MKFTKIIAIALASVVAFSSCQEKPGNASGDAAVGFASETLEYGLGSEYIKIPIVTTGETSVYPIKVTVGVAAYNGDFAAVEDVDYMITSKEIFVASAESKPTVEIKIVNPKDADELRFVLEIKEQTNAQSISVKNATVICKKSDLDRICGNWSVVGQNNEGAYSETWKIFNEGGNPCIQNIFGETAGYMTGTFEDGVLSFELGDPSNAIAAYNFTGIGVAYVIPTFGGYTADGKVSIGTGTLTGTVSEDFSQIVWNFPSGYGICGAVYSTDGATRYGYFYAPLLIKDNTITKIPKVVAE